MRRWLGILSVLACYFLIAAFISPATGGSPMRDFGAYYAAGATWDMHEDPYGTAIWSTERTLPQVDPHREELLPFINPPLLLPVLGLLARLPFGLAAMVWSLLLSLAMLGLVLASFSLASRTVSWTRLLVGTAFAIVFAPILSGVMLGQLAVIAVSALAVAAWGYERSGFAGPAATWIAALQPPLLLPLAVWFRSWRSAHALLASGVTYMLLWIGLTAAGILPALSSYLALAREHGSAERFALIQYTPASIAYGFGASPGIAVGIAILVAVLALGTWLGLMWHQRDPVISFTIGCALAPFIIPFFHEHDFTLAFPALIVALVRNSAALGWTVAATVLIGVNWVWLMQRPDEAVLSGSIAFVLAGVAYCIAWRKLRQVRLFFPVIGAFAVLVFFAMIAQHHPAPIWPDSMQPFAIAPHAPAAAVWHAEQAASGMFQHNAFWALLRCTPFIGCIILVASLHRSRDSRLSTI